MKLLVSTILIIASMITLGCNTSEPSTAERHADAKQFPIPSTPESGRAGGGTSGTLTAQTAQTSLAQADSVENQNQVVNRKIIRNADFILETDDPTEGQRRITSIAESLGGFVITSEFKQNDYVTDRSSQIVKVTIRIPSSQFSQAVETIRGYGRVIDEKESGQDVTEEYIDLEARIRTKKALEAQFLEIMKQAKKVSEALEVQSQIAEVRSDIESLEGRRRFLENRSALSTINITLQTPAPIVSSSTRGFSHDVKQAFGDGIDLAASLITGLIRLLIVMVPITLFILLPIGLFIRFLVRRIKWPKKSEPVAE